MSQTSTLLDVTGLTDTKISQNTSTVVRLLEAVDSIGTGRYSIQYLQNLSQQLRKELKDDPLK
nr:MAG: hypothetical protein [Microviridae sp.]